MLSWLLSWWYRPPKITVEADPAPQVVLPRSFVISTPADDPPTSLITYLEVLKGDKKAPKSPKASKLHETV